MLRPRTVLGSRRVRSGGASLGILLLSVLLALQLAAPVLAAGTLDQSQTGGVLPVLFGNTLWLGQTFTAGLTGNLDQVDVRIARVGNSGPLTVEIRNAAGNLPDGL